MAPDFMVTVDTEADNEWIGTGEPTYENIHHLPRFQELCDRHGVRPTYLTTYDVAADHLVGRILRRLANDGRCEVGAHLHSWSTPPYFKLPTHPAARKPYLHEYPAEVQREKLATLGAMLRERLGVAPVSYRGGRWSFDAVAARLLVAEGYLVDSSVTPGVTWQANPGCSPGSGGPDFQGAPVVPYRLHHHEVTLPGSLELLEVPVSIAGRGLLSRTVNHASATPGSSATRFQRLRRRVLNKSRLCRLVWLRPGYSSFGEMAWVCQRLVRQRTPVLNLMFHSSELIPGGSPRIRTEEDSTVFWQTLDTVFKHVIMDLGARPVTLGEYATAWWRHYRAQPKEVVNYAF